MWKLTGHPKTQTVTANLAKQFAEMERAPSDRPLSEIRLRVYEKLMRDGAFRPMQWAACFCRATGATYRVNGKHTSLLCSRLPLKELAPLFAVVEYYECDNLEDVARLYATYDSRMQSRNATDINMSFASCVPELTSVDYGTVNLCAAAIWYAAMQDQYSKIQPQERAEAILEHHDFIVWIFGMVGRRTGGYLKRMPVIAAMYATWQKHPRIATEFWTEVRDDTGTSPDQPTRKLARFLLLNHLRGGGQSDKPLRNRIRPREFFVKCLHAWNAYRAGEGTKLSYFADSKVPDVK